MKNGQLTDDPNDLSYSLAPDLDIVQFDEHAWLFHSATSSSRIGGPSARLLVEQIIPLLRNGCLWGDLVAGLPEVEPTELKRALDQLVDSGILRRTAAAETADPALEPLLALLEALHLPQDIAIARLTTVRIAIFGLEGAGARLAVLLAQCGVRRFVLADPFPCRPGNLPLLPFGGRAAVGRPLQELVAEVVRASSPDPENLEIVLGPRSLTREYVDDLVASSDCVVSCFDRGFGAIHHWINRASLQAGVPSVYSEAAGQQGWAGPLVLPYKTACYMCYRMRAVACAEDSAAALAYEAHLDRQNLPRLYTRAVLPSLMPQLAGILTTAVLQVLLGFKQPVLAGRVLELQALTLATITHPVLRQPNCPQCRADGPARSEHPDLPELLAAGDHPVELLQIVPELVSPVTGLIREVNWYDKDATEPTLPYIYRVTLGDHHFNGEVAAGELTCWGKGLTEQDARISGFGEAVERYSGDWLNSNVVVYAKRAELDGPSLHPADLVLYAPDQYATLPYHPYEETNRLGWVRGRSLGNGEAVFIPALAASLGYQPRLPEEYLCQSTSNGLAAGASLPRAILAATYEVLERDALMNTWFARLPAQRIDPFTHPDPQIRALCEAYRRRGVEISLWRLPTDHPCAVFLALALEQAGGAGPAAIVALGADLNPAVAARKAILEVGQVRPMYRRDLRRPDVQQRCTELVQDPRSVRTLHDHGLLYCSPDMRHALDFLLDRTPEAPDWASSAASDPLRQLEQLVTHFRANSGDLIYYNLTPPDLAQRGLAATRVILPGFQPVAFGAQEQRLGGSRLYDLPRRLGFASTLLTREDLNPYPHPFA